MSTPWKNSPGFLEQAEAALAPPEGSILHYRYEETLISKDFGCTVSTGPNEVWIDQTLPHRYRALLSHNLGDLRGLPDPQEADSRTLACRDWTRTVEVGGALYRGSTLMFEPPDTLSLSPVRFLGDADPVIVLREAIRTGRARHEGRAEVDGRTVERISVDCLFPPCPGPRDYAYVDPETFALVREEWPSGYTFVPEAGRELRFDVVVRYLTFEYLPGTAANLARADIRAQHPNATGP